MRSRALCVQVWGVIAFCIEKAPLIKLKNKRKMQSKRRLLGTKSYLQSLSSKLFWLMWDSVPPMELLRRTYWNMLFLQGWLFMTFSIFNYSFFPAFSSKYISHNMHACAMFLFMCVYSCQVVYCVNRRIKISEEMALPALTLPPPRLYLSSCPPSDFSPSDPHLLLWSKRKQTSTPRAHCKSV